MAKKKDFSKIENSGIFRDIEQGAAQRGQQGTASPEEAAERASKMKTQGRKGCHLIRISTAYTPENHTFIKVMSKVTGHTMNEFVNIVVEQYRQDHIEMYNAAKGFIDQVNGKSE